MVLDNLLWQDVLDLLRDKMSRPSFETWLKRTKARVVGDHLAFIAPNEFSRDWLEARYLSAIEDAIFSITGVVPKLTVLTDAKLDGDSNSTRIDNILRQIEELSFSERDKLFSILEERSSWNIRDIEEENPIFHNHPFAINDALDQSQATHKEMDAEKIDRVSILESEVKLLREALSGLHIEVKFLEMTLANKFPGTNRCE